MLTARDQLTGNTSLVQREIADLQATIAERQAELSELRNQSEAAPHVAGLAQSQMDTVEALIGAPILATIRIGDSDHEAAEPIIFAESALRLAHPVQSKLPEWIRQSFDIARSEPEALRTLAAEMTSEYGPDFGDVLQFRGHLRRFPNRPASFIGLESRRRPRRQARCP